MPNVCQRYAQFMYLLVESMQNISEKCQRYYVPLMPKISQIWSKYMPKNPNIWSSYAPRISNIQTHMSKISQIYVKIFIIGASWSHKAKESHKANIAEGFLRSSAISDWFLTENGLGRCHFTKGMPNLFYCRFNIYNIYLKNAKYIFQISPTYEQDITNMC